MQPGNDDNISDKDPASFFTGPEAFTTFATSHDDPPRVAMNSTQTRHTVPLVQGDKLLVGTGAEKTAVKFMGKDFVFNAKENGVIEELDEKSGIMIVKYDTGEKEAYDFSTILCKNGGGGFFITNKKSTQYKKGDRFTKGETLVTNDNFFSGYGNDVDLLVGKLTKVGVYGGYYTYEDSVLISETLSEKMATYVTMEKQLKLGPNTNVSYFAKKGTKVKTNDPIIVFEDSYDEKEANSILSRLGDEYQQEILELGRNTVQSKYTGEIADIDVYYTVPFEELSPSLQDLVREVNKETNAKKKILNKHFKDQKDSGIILKPTEQVVPTPDGKVKGIEVGDGVLLRIFIRYKDKLETGDKITFFSALKGIVQQTLPAELAPYSEFGGEEEPIEAVMAPGGIQARMTGSTMMNLYANKVLIGLKKRLKEVYGVK